MINMWRKTQEWTTDELDAIRLALAGSAGSVNHALTIVGGADKANAGGVGGSELSQVLEVVRCTGLRAMAAPVYSRRGISCSPVEALGWRVMVFVRPTIEPSRFCGIEADRTGWCHAVLAENWGSCLRGETVSHRVAEAVDRDGYPS